MESPKPAEYQDDSPHGRWAILGPNEIFAGVLLFLAFLSVVLLIVRWALGCLFAPPSKRGSISDVELSELASEEEEDEQREARGEKAEKPSSTGSSIAQKVVRVLFCLLHLLIHVAFFGVLLYLVLVAVALDRTPLVVGFAMAVPVVFTGVLSGAIVIVMWSELAVLSMGELWKDVRGMLLRHWRRILLLTVVLSSVVFLLSAGSCDLCLPDEPFYIDMSSKLTRYLTRGQNEWECVGGGVCHLYLLAGEDMSSEVQVIFHTAEPVLLSKVVVVEEGSAVERSFEGSVESLDLEVPRFVSSVLVNGLKPNTEYAFGVWLDGEYSEAGGSFRTTPAFPNGLSDFADHEELVHFAVSGDIGAWDAAEPLTQRLAESDPYFVVIGGDVAYGNAFATCYVRWDRTLGMLSKRLVDTHGRLIPWVVLIGNHESGGQRVPVEDVPFFTEYFPYGRRGPDGSFVAVAKKERLFHTHRIPGLMRMVGLDSDMVNRWEEQSEWLKGELASADEPYVTAAYHVPLFPSTRAEWTKSCQRGRVNWMPIFDEFHLSCAFEHHDHNYRRSYPLVAPDEWTVSAEMDPDGTVYYGAGSWGVAQEASHDHWFMAFQERSKNLFISASLSKSALETAAIDIDGFVVDTGVVRPRRHDGGGR